MIWIVTEYLSSREREGYVRWSMRGGIEALNWKPWSLDRYLDSSF